MILIATISSDGRMLELPFTVSHMRADVSHQLSFYDYVHKGKYNISRVWMKQCMYSSTSREHSEMVSISRLEYVVNHQIKQII